MKYSKNCLRQALMNRTVITALYRQMGHIRGRLHCVSAWGQGDWLGMEVAALCCDQYILSIHSMIKVHHA